MSEGDMIVEWYNKIPAELIEEVTKLLCWEEVEKMRRGKKDILVHWKDRSLEEVTWNSKEYIVEVQNHGHISFQPR